MKRATSKAMGIIIVFLCVLSTTIVQFLTIEPKNVMAEDGNAQDIAPCRVTFKDVWDASTHNISFGEFKITQNGSLISIDVTFRNVDGSTRIAKTYSYSFEKYEVYTDSEGMTYSNEWIYKSNQFPDSKMTITGVSDTHGLSMGINQTAATNAEDYDNFVKDFLEEMRQNGFETNTCSYQNLFADGNIQNVAIEFRGDEPPIIKLPGVNSGSIVRPDMTFQLYMVFNKGGRLAINDVIIVFKYLKNTSDGSIKDEYRNLVIKILYSGDTFPARALDADSYSGYTDYDRTKIHLTTDSESSLYNHIYNGMPPTDDPSKVCGSATSYQSSNPDRELSNWPEGTTPSMQCLNISETGWLAKWIGVDNIRDVDASDPRGEIEEEADLCDAITARGIAGWIAKAFCGLGLMIEKFANNLLESAFNMLKLMLGYFDPK